jgi:dipeptidyl aminopeptidase/acylaminoacyl peptidase
MTKLLVVLRCTPQISAPRLSRRTYFAIVPFASLWLIDRRSLVGSLDAPYAGLKATKTESGDINFVVYCLANEDGTAYNPDAVEEPLSTGGLYDAIFVRHWDFYITQQRNAVFGGVLSAGYGNGSLSLSGELKNLLTGINATVTRPESPIPPFGDQGDYDISPDGKTVAFISKSPDLPKANFTASYVYIVPHDGSVAAVAINGPGTTAPETAQGASFFPRFSPDSTKIAYGQQDGIFYESDRTKLYVATIDGLNAEITAVAEDWDSVVGGVTWGPEGKLYVAAEVHAMNRLFVVPYDADASFKPENFTNQYSYVQDWFVYPDGTALITAAASWSSRIWYTQKPGEEPSPVFSANEVDPELAGLKPDSVTNFWFTNADGDEIHTLVFLPTDFDESKKYPLCFVVHGGPQVAQGDTWSTRWNLRLWADVNKCVVTTTQFTGTPGYGQAFTDKITNNWGGTPYTDLEEAFEYIKENIPYIDTDNAIAAGASYGAYM